MEPPSWLAVVDHLMQGFPWELGRGPVAMGTAFNSWTLEGHGSRDLQFCERGTTPDEAVARAVIYLSTCHGVKPWEARDTLARLRAEVAARDAEPPQRKPQPKPPEWRPVTSERPVVGKAVGGGHMEYGYPATDGTIVGGFPSAAEAERAHQAAEAEAAHRAKAAA